MSDATPVEADSLPPELALRLNEACNHFEAACRAGRAPCVEDCLAEVEEAVRPALRRELVAIEEHYRLLDDEPGRPPAADAITPATSRAGSGADAPPSWDDYDLLEELGRGGMGVVFRARQRSLNRVVALKRTLAGDLAAAAAVQRFQAEAEAAAGLDHPHIVPIYEVGEHHGQPFFSMKLVEGGSLAAQLDRFRGDVRGSARLVAVVARAVHHAHQRGILHRDLKPGNILLDNQGRPYVTDFGLARRIEADVSLTQSGTPLGTPSYMAPEQATGAKVLSTAADVYGLGTILYECLTGRPPFQAATVLETLNQVKGTEPVRPRALNPAVDRDLETICLKCLKKDAQRRYGSAEALAEDLESWLAGEPIRTRPAGVGERLAKWARRRPAVTALLAALVVVAIGSFAAILGFWRQAVGSLGQEQLARRAEEELRKQAEASHAAALVALARAEWTANDLDAARQHLAQCPPHLRGPDWRYLHRACHAELRRFLLPPGILPSLGVTFSPNGTHLGTGSGIVWDVDTGQPVMKTPPARCLAFTADEVISAGVSRARGANPEAVVVVEVLDLATGVRKEQFHHQCPRFPLYLTLSPDGSRIAYCWTKQVGAPTEVRIADVRTGEGPSIPLPDARQLVTNNACRVIAYLCPQPTSPRILDVAKAQTRAVPSRDNSTWAMALTPDGRWFVGGGTEPASEFQVITVWDVATLQERVSIRQRGKKCVCVAISPNGERIAIVADDRTVGVWDVATGAEILTLRGYTGYIRSLAFSPDGCRLASAETDGTVRIWDVRPMD